MSDQAPHEHDDHSSDFEQGLDAPPERRKKKPKTAMIIVLSIVGALGLAGLLALLALFVICSDSSW